MDWKIARFATSSRLASSRRKSKAVSSFLRRTKKENAETVPAHAPSCWTGTAIARRTSCRWWSGIQERPRILSRSWEFTCAPVAGGLTAIATAGHQQAPSVGGHRTAGTQSSGPTSSLSAMACRPVATPWARGPKGTPWLSAYPRMTCSSLPVRYAFWMSMA